MNLISHMYNPAPGFFQPPFVAPHAEEVIPEVLPYPEEMPAKKRKRRISKEVQKLSYVRLGV